MWVIPVLILYFIVEIAPTKEYLPAVLKSMH